MSEEKTSHNLAHENAKEIQPTRADFEMLCMLSPLKLERIEKITATSKAGKEYKRDTFLLYSEASKKYYRFLFPFGDTPDDIVRFIATIKALREINPDNNVFQSVQEFITVDNKSTKIWTWMNPESKKKA